MEIETTTTTTTKMEQVLWYCHQSQKEKVKQWARKRAVAKDQCRPKCRL
jgi:hypothetical protein